MEYIKLAKAAAKWGISARRARILCAEGKIPGAIKKGKLYMVPENAQKPRDGRFKAPSLFEKIEQKSDII